MVRLVGVTMECAEPELMAAFYGRLLVMPTRIVDSPDHVVIGNEHAGLTLGFLKVRDYRRPTWPELIYPQQVHLDVPVYDAAVAADLMAELKAVRLPDVGGDCPVWADPAGHPFCLCLNPQPTEDPWPALPGLVGNVVLDCARPQHLASGCWTPPGGLLLFPTRVSGHGSRSRAPTSTFRAGGIPNIRKTLPSTSPSTTSTPPLHELPDSDFARSMEYPVEASASRTPPVTPSFSRISRSDQVAG